MFVKYQNLIKSILFLISAKVSLKLILYYLYCKIKKIFFINIFYKKKLANM